MNYTLENRNISSKEELNKYISDEQILTFYFQEFDLNRHYHSPFKEENNPSFIISYYNGELKWRDFGQSNKPFNAVEFVTKKFNIGFYEALNKIYKDIGSKDSAPIVRQYPKQTKLTHQVEYVNKWEDWQLEYWFKGHIKESTLKKFSVKWCKELWFNDRLFAKGSKYNLMYFYDHSTIPFVESWSVYRPYAPQDKKFRKHNILNHIMGYDLLPPSGDLLVITKSYKDIMILYELGIPAIAPHNENVPIPKDIIDELKLRFDKIYINYDNDNTGVKSSIQFTREHGLNYWNVPVVLKCKDPFECSCIYGLDKVFDLLNEKINRDYVHTK